MKNTKIEWTQRTWNPITGCTKISAGCQNCYASVMAHRLQAMNSKKYANGFNLTLHEGYLKEPLMLKTPRTIFVCSMSDLFHEKVPFEFIDKIIDIIEQTPQHSYQILTKRAERMHEYFSSREAPINVWLGVTVENKTAKNRIELLRNTNASVRFVSCEPLLEDLGELDLRNISRVIVGGESGSNARPIRLEWILSIKDYCEKHNALFFFKQWGAWGSDGIKRNKRLNGNKLNGKTYQDWPTKH